MWMVGSTVFEMWLVLCRAWPRYPASLTLRHRWRQPHLCLVFSCNLLVARSTFPVLRVRHGRRCDARAFAAVVEGSLTRIC